LRHVVCISHTSDFGPEEKRPLGKPVTRHEDNIKMDPKEILCESAVLIHLAENMVQRRGLVNTIMNLQIPRVERNFLIAEQLSASQGLCFMKLVE
jgi:hypothetical protein